MKKILLLFVPLVALASYDIDSVEDCEAMKADLQSQAQSQKNALPALMTDIIYTRSAVYSLSQKADEFQGRASAASDADVKNAWTYASVSCQNSYNQFSPYSDSLLQDYFTISNRIYSLSSSIDSINCLACSADSSSTTSTSNCCDFTEILASLGIISNSINLANYNLSTITNELDFYLSNITNELNLYLSTITNQLEHGFSSQEVLFRFLGTNLSASVSLDYAPSSIYMGRYQRMFLNGRSAHPYTTLVNVGNYSNLSQWGKGLMGDVLSTLIYQGWVNSDTGVSLNNYAYDFRNNSFPVLTNELLLVHHDQTNYFSFFRGELGVQGALADWTPTPNGQNYYEFLTNHYIAAVTGGTLSGNLSSKTNWFARIESLLAALVFQESGSSTNTVDVEEGEVEQSLVGVALKSVNQIGTTYHQQISTASQGIISLCRSYFDTFDSAAMPSHVVLMKLSSGDSEDIEIAFQSDSLGILVESCRVVSTLCWSSVGIFLLYKFLVWSARCVVVACQFIYRAISSVFRS